MSDGVAPLVRLLRRLDLVPAGDDAFDGFPGRGEGPLFGGLVAAQAVMAAGRTVAERVFHSLHAHFLRPGRHGLAIRYRVTRLRDGRSFDTRVVVAEQDGETILHGVAGFCAGGEGVQHQEVSMPEAPAPQTLADWDVLRGRLHRVAGAPRTEGPIEIRVCDPDGAEEGLRLPARRRVWFRPRGVVPDDPLVRAALLVFASDRTLLSTAARPHGIVWGPGVGASLDHAVWVHCPPRFDDWTLFVTESPVASGGRALLFGAMYTADGRRLASVAQEGLLRRQAK